MNAQDRPDNGDGPDPIVEALRGMPRVAASPGFTVRVLARAAASIESEVGVGWTRGWALFAASLVVVSAVTAWQWERRERRQEWLGQVEAIRQESRSLGAELSDLRAAEQAPVVYLGGDDSVDLILDLEQLRQARASNARSVRSEGSELQPIDQGETL